MIVTTVMNKVFSEIKVSLVCYYIVQKEMTSFCRENTRLHQLPVQCAWYFMVMTLSTMIKKKYHQVKTKAGVDM
jgi:hypothetical protein